MINIISFEDSHGNEHSLFCLNLTIFPPIIYLELFGLVVPRHDADEQFNRLT